MTNSKLALVAAAVAIAFASPAFAKTIHHAQHHYTAVPQPLYDSTAAPPSAQLQNPYYAPYINHYSGFGDFVVGGFH